MRTGAKGRLHIGDVERDRPVPHEASQPGIVRRHLTHDRAERAVPQTARVAAQQLVIAGGEDGGRAMQEVRARTDSAGVARFAIGASGKWFVKFIHMVPVGRDSIDYESKWATLTFEVR